MFLRKTILCVSLLLLSTQSIAGVFLQTGLHLGGDSLADVTFVGGDSETIKAGELISASAGYEADINDTLLLKLSAGLKFDTITAENGSIDFTRYPLTAMFFIKGEKLNFGLGVTQHTGIELTGDGVASIPTIEFDDATGLVLQLDYLLGKRAYVSLQLTAIDYQPVKSNVEVSGNSLGVLIGYRFGK